MMLAFRARQSTKDVDAIFAPPLEIREAADRAAAELNLAKDWLNDAAKGFLSEHGQFTHRGVRQFANLRVLTPTPQYLLAMKVMAARSGDVSLPSDKSDIAFLIQHLRLGSSEQVMDIVQSYYDPSRILPQSWYLVDEIIQEGTQGSSS